MWLDACYGLNSWRMATTGKMLRYWDLCFWQDLDCSPEIRERTWLPRSEPLSLVHNSTLHMLAVHGQAGKGRGGCRAYRQAKAYFPYIASNMRCHVCLQCLCLNIVSKISAVSIRHTKPSFGVPQCRIASVTTWCQTARRHVAPRTGVCVLQADVCR